jgi:NitT/TauT family transport system substrate-binding protein
MALHGASVSRKVALSWLSAAALAARPGRLSAAAPPVKLRVAGSATDGLSAMFYAINTGMYERAGLDVEYVQTSSGGVATTAVVSGAYEIGVTSLISIFSAHLRKVPILLTVPQVMYTPQNPFGLLQVAADSAIRKPADLNGRTIGCFGLGDLNQLATSAWLDRNGGDSSTLKFTEIPFGASAESIVQHRVDAMILIEPLLDDALTNGKTRTLGDAYGAVSNHFMITGYISRPEWLDTNSDVAKAFLKVTEAANAFANAHPSATAPFTAKAIGMPLPALLKMHRPAFGSTMDAAMVQPLIDGCAKYKIIAESFDARDVIWSPSLH